MPRECCKIYKIIMKFKMCQIKFSRNIQSAKERESVLFFYLNIILARIFNEDREKAF